ncbi:MAG: cation:proton antiporter [Isosphaeraceae bacterium]|nr:cation:proton antiporter [Isosphaeraceae bacterium]
MLGAAKLLGALAQKLGQPAVLGELVAGVIVGGSVLGLVDPEVEVIHLLSELGVLILLFAIGLEIDLRALLRVGGASVAVAIVGVALPFVGGYALCRLLGLDRLVAITVGASLTATSVGITARVLSDLGRLREPEGQIVLGAAVFDDVIGLIILSVVVGLTRGQAATFGGIAGTTGVAFGFLLATLLIGHWIIPMLFRATRHLDLPGTATILGLLLAFSLAWLADRAGSAPIIGAFAAGVLLAQTPRAHEIEKGITALGHFFVPLFFIAVGAAVDLRVFTPLDPARHRTLIVGGLLLVIAVLSKFAAGYAPFWTRARKSVIGVGMIPRGEVGLIYAQMGLSGGVLDAGLFGAITLMVLVTTFLAPPLLKWLYASGPPAGRPAEAEGIEDLVNIP